MRPCQEGAGGRARRAQAVGWKRAATADGESAGGRPLRRGAALEQPLERLEAVEESESSGDSGDSDDSGSPPAAGPSGRDLSDMSFEELLQVQSDTRTRVYKQVTSGKKTAKPTKATVKQQQGKKGPLEMSAKKPVPFLRQVIAVTKKVHRDPRFDDLSGEYKPEIFMKTYSFLDSIKKQEKEMIQKQLKKCRNVEQKEKLQQLLNRMTQQEQAQKKQQKMRERELSLKRQQRELAKQGKKPFFLKKSEKRKLELAEKYTELKRSGKLESFLNKKRKRNAIKDKRRLPSQKDL
ncbi:ribosomal RNA processing protein 36 homolog [Pluvialis apricaria]